MVTIAGEAPARRWWAHPWAGRARWVLAGFVIFMVAGNAAIAVPSLVLQWRAPAPKPAAAAEVRDVANLALVDDKVWRGAAPSSLAGYESLAAAGVTTVVDLRAESGLEAATADAAALGLAVVSLPIRDGQTPTPEQIETFVRTVDKADGTVFLHCGAGVGRTGSMAAAYLVATGQTNGIKAMWRNLTVGPPSLEQLAFAAGLTSDSAQRPGPILTSVSRVLDAPRRLWSVLG